MSSEDPASRLRAAWDLFEFGERMQRRRLRRRCPDAADSEIDDEMRAWLQPRPGAEGGDCPGSPSRRFG